MTYWKKALSLLLALCLLASLFAACGGKDSDSSAGGESSTGSAAGNEGGAAEDANFNPGLLYTSDAADDNVRV